MSKVAQHLSKDSQIIFKRLFGIDSRFVDLNDMVPAKGLHGDLGRAIDSQKLLTFLTDFREILMPAAFARDSSGFLLREATNLARQLFIMDPVKYAIHAPDYLKQESIPALQAMVIVEALRRSAEKSFIAAERNLPSSPDIGQSRPAAPAPLPLAQPMPSYEAGMASTVEERKQVNYLTMRNAIQDQAAFHITFDDPSALEEEFSIPATAAAALHRLGFEQIAQETNGARITKFRHKQSGLRLNMVERGEAGPTFSLGLGLLEGTFVPGTYEDFPATIAYKANIDVGSDNPQQRRIAFYQVKNIGSDELPERLRELEALVTSRMMVLTKLVNPAETRTIGDRIKIEGSPVKNLAVHDSVPTLARLLALNHIALDHRRQRFVSVKTAGKHEPQTKPDNKKIESSADLVNCVIVGMQGLPLTALMQRLRGDTSSPYAEVAKAAACEVSGALGPMPRFEIRFLRSSGSVDYDAAINYLSPDRENLLCIGVDIKTYIEAQAFIGQFRRQGERCLAVAIYEPDLPKDQIASLNRNGFDRIIANNEDPAAIEALMQSLVRNNAIRNLGTAGVEKYGPLCVVWDSKGQRSTRQLEKVYMEGENGEKHGVHLTGKELALFERILQRPGVVVTKHELQHYLYAGKDEADIKIVDVSICRVRNKLSAALKKAGYDGIGNQNGPIETIWGKGYMFNPNFGQNVSHIVVEPAGMATAPAQALTL